MGKKQFKANVRKHIAGLVRKYRNASKAHRVLTADLTDTNPDTAPDAELRELVSKDRSKVIDERGLRNKRDIPISLQQILTIAAENGVSLPRGRPTSDRV